MLDEHTRALAKGVNFATLTTLRKDGSPTAQVMWVDCDDEHILINTEVHRVKYRHMVRDPRVVVVIIDRENPYSYAEIRGEVVEFAAVDQYTLEGDAFSSAVIARTHPPVPLEDAIRNMRVIDAIFRSGESGGWEEV